LPATRPTSGSCATIPRSLGLQFVDGIRRADRDNAIDVYISDEHDDVLRDGEWQKWFKERPRC
jgi:phosphoribosylaminoimidazolecarboxamide formyltransferase/IMP cyclohydrolase